LKIVAIENARINFWLTEAESNACA